MNIILDGVSKRFGSQAVLDRVSLTLPAGGLFFLLGPSGCGKTTLLRILAGFYEPDAGMVRFGDRPMNGVPPQDRRTALVFQNYALWPHLTVFENVAYGLRLRGVPAPELRRRVEEALAQARIDSCRDRKPGTLSGGQQQRVALARALVVRPDLLLLDEPLSNLDARLRVEMREEIARLHRETGRTALYVTHDQEEALSIADRIAVMREGRIEQAGTPLEIYERPATAFVASFLGEINFAPGDGPLARALRAPRAERIGFRPERVALHAEVAAGLPARVVRSTFLGGRHRLLLRTPEGETFDAYAADPLAADAAVRFSVAPHHLLPFAA